MNQSNFETTQLKEQSASGGHIFKEASQGPVDHSSHNQFQGDDNWQWKMDRLGKLTASRVVDIMPSEKTGKYLEGRESYLSELIAERISGEPMPNIDTPAMRWGKAQEGPARNRYEQYVNAKRGVVQSITTWGVINHLSIKGFAASPDLLDGEDGLGEIKCLHTKNHLDTILNGTIKRDYIWQMVAQLACTGRKFNNYISFDPRLGSRMDLWVVEFKDWYKDGMLETAEREAKLFLEELEERAKKILCRPEFGDMYKDYEAVWLK